MTPFKEYRSGLLALEKQDYPEAVQRLENYYHANPKPGSLEHYQACKALVKAYDQVNELDKALAICQELTECEKPNIRSWAKRWQDKLSNKAAAIAEEALAASTEEEVNTVPADGPIPEPSAAPLSLTDANQLLSEGREALRSQQYGQAIHALEQFRLGGDASHPDFYQAQMWLATAYQKAGQLEQAKSLGTILADNPATQAWAEKFIQSLSLLVATEVVTGMQAAAKADSVSAASSQGSPEKPFFKHRTLAEFKDYCRQNLVEDLKEYETKRQSALKALAIVGAILLIILILILTQVPQVFQSLPLFPIPTEGECIRDMITSGLGQKLSNADDGTAEQLFFDFILKCQEPRFSFPNFRSLLLVATFFLFGIIGCLWSWAIFYSVQTEMYERGFKTKIIEKVIRYINNDQGLSYAAYGDNSLTRMAILRSRLFPALNSTFHLQQDDCVYGNIGPANVYFSEVVAEHEIYHAFIPKMMPFLLRRSRGFLTFIKLPILVLVLMFSFLKASPFIVIRMFKGQRFDYDSFKDQVGNQVTRRQVFKGLFFRSEFNKSFQGETVVFTGSLASKLKQLNRSGQLVKLEDPEFDQLYTVYSDDQVEARYILSTSLMERLVKFRKKAQRPVSISFSENQIFIAIHHDRDLFEAQLFKTMLSFRPMQDYFDNFQLMLGIIQDLNLNRRIWTRQ